jgi:hypothetical protein
MIGKKFSNGWKIRPIFSNDWKKSFQWLEKLPRFFQRLEKIFGIFPMVGKMWFFGDGGDAAGTMEAAFRAWGVRKHSPPSERGVPPGGRWLKGCSFGVDGKGGGGSTAGGRRDMLPHGRIHKGLEFLLPE